jgi:dTDP-4-dehydrorhamnose reductase
VEPVVVVGAAGMLGREIMHALRQAGVDAVPAGRAPRLGWIRFDAERDDPAELLRGRPQLVVNCAGVLATDLRLDPGAGARAEAVNARFPPALAHAAGAAGARLIHISTDAVFRADVGRCFEDDDADAEDVYGLTKRRGEPDAPNALTLRFSFVGLDPARRRGLLEWLLAQAPRAEVDGYLDQVWNGLVSTQAASICAALAEPALFERARGASAVLHLFEDPPLTKHALVELAADAFSLDVDLVARPSGRPSTRILGSRYDVLHEHLESVASRAAALRALAERGPLVDV